MKLISAAIVMSAFAAPAFAAEPIEGTWKRDNGTLIQYSGSAGKFCGTVLNGKFKGQSIGCMSGTGENYKGTVNVLDEGKSYSGKARVVGSKMELSGCALGGLICKTGVLVRQ